MTEQTIVHEVALAGYKATSTGGMIGGMIMLFRTLLKLKERNGLTDDLKNKIDVFFAVGRITEEQYNDLMDVNKKEVEDSKELVN